MSRGRIALALLPLQHSERDSGSEDQRADCDGNEPEDISYRHLLPTILCFSSTMPHGIPICRVLSQPAPSAIVPALRGARYLFAVPGSAMRRCCSASIDDGVTEAMPTCILFFKPLTISA